MIPLAPPTSQRRPARWANRLRLHQVIFWKDGLGGGAGGCSNPHGGAGTAPHDEGLRGVACTAGSEVEGGWEIVVHGAALFWNDDDELNDDDE